MIELDKSAVDGSNSVDEGGRPMLISRKVSSLPLVLLFLRVNGRVGVNIKVELRVGTQLTRVELIIQQSSRGNVASDEFSLRAPAFRNEQIIMFQKLAIRPSPGARARLNAMTCSYLAATCSTYST